MPVSFFVILKLHICYNQTMAKKRRKKKKVIILFIEVFVLVLTMGLALILLLAEKQKKDAPDSNKGVIVIKEEEIADNDNDKTIESEQDKSSTDEILDDGTRYGYILADEELCAKERIYARNAKSEDCITLLFAGDVGLGQGYANLGNLIKKNGDVTEVFNEDALATMRGADIFMINNEFTFTTRGEPTPDKTYTFRCDPKYAYVLQDMGVDIVSLANNHSYDYGEVSLTDTIDTLDGIDMPYVGAGYNIEEAVKPVYFIVNDTRIAIVSATQIERLSTPDTKGATKTSAGTFRCWYDDRILDVIKEAKECSDYVIAYIHWGTELEEAPDWAQLELAPKLAKAGADLIVGDHPHILQKLDYVENSPVIYSLGNYWFNSKEMDTGLLEAKIFTDGGGMDVRFIPVVQKNCSSVIVKNSERDRILEYMRLISPGVDIDEDGYISRK